MSTHEIVDAEFRESSALAVRDEPAAPPALFGTTDPVEIVTNAVRVADALKAVVVSKKLISVIQGKEYPQVEAWLTLAAMLRLTTVCEWSRRVENGWEARVFVRDAAGSTIGAAEAQCLVTERTKKSWEDYAIRSMAQTRATSKALRSVLAFVMVLAGFQPTPAEEMPDPAPPKPATPPAPSPTDLLIDQARALGVIPAGDREQGINALRNWARAQNVAWGVATLTAALESLRSPNHEGAADVTAPSAGAKPVPGAVRNEPGPRTAADRAAAEIRSRASEVAPVTEVLATASQRAKAMALHGELRHSDDDRRDLYRRLFGVSSFKDLTREQVGTLITHLSATETPLEDEPEPEWDAAIGGGA